MRLDHVAHDGESQPRPCRTRSFDEAIEDPRQELGWDAGAVIGHGQTYRLPAGLPYHPDVATTMRLMEGVDSDVMLGLEDPILHADVEGFKYLKEHLGVPLIRHISLPYTQDIRDMITFVRADAVNDYNFNGTAYNSILLAEIAHLEGKPCWRGSEVDLGISETMGLHIAAASINCTIPSDIFGELVRVDDLLVDGIVFENGAAIVPQGEGLGVSLDYTAMEKYKTGNQLTVAAASTKMVLN